MIFANLTILILTLNLSMNNSFDTDGLLWIDYRIEDRYNYLGWMTPHYGGNGVMTIWSTDKNKIPYIIEHELKHLKCWRLEGNEGYVNNFIHHKGCFENITIK